MFPFGVFHRRRTTLASDELVEFYPSYGYRTTDGQAWRLVIQGCAFDPKLPWFRRRPVMGMMRRAMRVDHVSDAFFHRRMSRFLLDSEKGRKISVRVDGVTYDAGESNPAGLFRQEIDVGLDVIGRIAENHDHATRWISYWADLPEGDQRVFTGRVQLIETAGVSIISDVDDTLKHSNVPNRRDLFHNTFLREFSPIPGMAHLYQDCAQLGAAFHFVSGSPWQLYEPLSEFFRDHQFPLGSYHLKPFRIRDTARKMRGPSPQLAHKRTAMEPILNAFPGRKFILIGDSGEQDPLIYGGFLRERPEQIAGVFIRTLRGETADDLRLQTAFQGCSPDRWRLYQSPDEIHQAVVNLVKEYREPNSADPVFPGKV